MEIRRFQFINAFGKGKAGYNLGPLLEVRAFSTHVRANFGHLLLFSVTRMNLVLSDVTKNSSINRVRTVDSSSAA